MLRLPGQTTRAFRMLELPSTLGIKTAAASTDRVILDLASKIRKAERDERVSITTALTPPKFHMGGYTKPKKIRNYDWLHGGRPSEKSSKDMFMPGDAFEPHTVILLEGRYLTKEGQGRINSLKYFVDVCRESDFEVILKKYNSIKAPMDALKAMDNAKWPFLSRKKGKRLQQENATITKEDDSSQNTGAQSEAPSNPEISTELSASPDTASVDSPNDLQASIRAQYLPTLETSPFFRPLLVITVPTRPMAVSLARLSKSLIHGFTYHAAINLPWNAAKPTINGKPQGCKLSPGLVNFLLKTGLQSLPPMPKDPMTYSLTTRMFRLNRMHEVSVNLATLLAAARSGIHALRSLVKATDRTLDDSALSPEVPPNNYQISVAVGNWYERGAQLRQDFEEASQELLKRFPQKKGPNLPLFVTYTLDEAGMRYDPSTLSPVPWPTRRLREPAQSVLEYRKMKSRLQAIENLIGDEAKHGQKELRAEKNELMKRMEQHIHTHLRDFALLKLNLHKDIIYPSRLPS